MNRRGFVGLFAAMIALPLTKIFPKRRTVKRKINLLLTAEGLLDHWNKGKSLLGEWCNCPEKIYLQKEDAAFKASVQYCSNHGYTTSCWMCDPRAISTEVCGKNHYPFSHKITLNEARKMVGSDSKYAEQLVNEYHKRSMTLAEAAQISIDRSIRATVRNLL